MDHTIKIKMGYFPYTVYVTFCEDEVKECSKRIIKRFKLDMKSCEKGLLGASISYGNRGFLIIPIDEGPETIVHEAYHAIDNMRRYMGAGFEDEMMAYSIEYVFKKANDFRQSLPSGSKTPPKESSENKVENSA